ncbi:tRNA threonylcarbamoyladenosine dehydratase [Limnobacter humi]|uniref:tRNA threonylcarbamoyladenosine dehydratase n=1 Tax=Limnobacter humi TaxID=1778671 RepID=A0ABT1WCF0_9BURK|nr:tRNA threonylcarbamoyladenosine dehydratase [Limnobacter humi]MCQ8895175.1 tRNA threonylcarbamoyladenosine dehydratase [Limnobacter humi]
MEVDADRRFGGLSRLYGDGFHTALQARAHVLVVGVGGVGSWAVEALARSGVGHLTLVDMDHVAESNINRQIQATDATLGQEKIRALAERIAAYAPHCQVTLVDDFVTPENAAAVLGRFFGKLGEDQHGVVLDCCDQARAKVAMALWMRQHAKTLFMAGSAGGKTQPWLLQPADLRDTVNDPLLSKVRYQLRRSGVFSRDAKLKMKLQAVYSPQPVMQGDACDTQAGLNCAGYGSAVTVTAGMGLQLAGLAINHWASLLLAGSLSA